MKKTVIRTLLSMSLAVAGMSVASEAQAASISQCTGQDGVVSRSVSLSSNTFKVTHADGILLGAGVAYNHTHTVTYERQLSAGATGEVSVTGGADWKIAKLDATVSYSLSVNGSKTSTSSITESFSVAAASRARNMIFVHGNNYASGTWKQLTCSRAPGLGTWYTGTVHSYQPTAWHGLFECNHNLYAAGSIMYQASVQEGC